jgi:hypothetical protein
MKKSRNRDAKASKVVGTGPVRYVMPQMKGGPLQISIDFRFATVPGAYYYADVLSLRHERQLAMVTLLLARFDAQAGRLWDRLDIVMPESALFLQFWNSSREVEKSLDVQMKALNISHALRPVGSKSLPRTTLFANVINVSTGGGESCLDFYYMPVRDIHLARQNRSEIGLEPIIRILSSPVLLKSLFELCRPFAASGVGLPTQSGRIGRVSSS